MGIFKTKGKSDESLGIKSGSVGQSSEGAWVTGALSAFPEDGWDRQLGRTWKQEPYGRPQKGGGAHLRHQNTRKRLQLPEIAS